MKTAGSVVVEIRRLKWKVHASENVQKQTRVPEVRGH